MKVKIVDVDCTDHDPISKWIPVDPNDVDIWITFHIGPSIGTGTDYFQGHFVTGNRAVDLAPKARYILIEKFDFEKVIQMVTDRLVAIDEATWEETAARINSFLYWEFENYQPSVQ